MKSLGRFLMAGLLAVVCCLTATAQRSKLSAMLQRLVSDNNEVQLMARGDGHQKAERLLCTFVKVETQRPDTLFSLYSCKPLANWGSIYIVQMPLRLLPALAREPGVSRIEASSPCSVSMDSTALYVNALPVYEGRSLPQAFTGRGVVLGLQDIGFDLTHPTFYSADLSQYRISALWDMLGSSWLGRKMPVGTALDNKLALLLYAHSADGLINSHGTHTLGIAAGSGYDSPYRGMAWESDICLVANGVVENSELIDSLDYYMYTSATDALGFKYIFDYAQSVGKPCVISFSEGYHETMDVDDQLFYAVLDSLTGPGRILVASAGNDGNKKFYFRKPVGVEAVGSFLQSSSASASFLLRTADTFQARLVVYNEHPDTLLLASDRYVGNTDSLFTDSLLLADGKYVVHSVSYPLAYDSLQQVVQVMVNAPHKVGDEGVPFSVELIGSECDAHFHLLTGQLVTNAQNPALTAGEKRYSIHAPAAAPSVVCVGATTYRKGFFNVDGKWHAFDTGENGMRCNYSGVGPALSGLCKPDVMAPGNNVVSAYSSYYREARPDASDADSYVKLFPHRGRTYVWASNAGTSMATPVVAGAVALWLQACPTLAPADVLDLLARTCRHNDESMAYPNHLYGHGEIDVYRGLLTLLGIDDIDGLSTSQPHDLDVQLLAGRRLVVRFPGVSASAVGLHVYNLQGRCVLSMMVPVAGNQAEADLSSLPSGVYAVQIGKSGSVLIRL